MIPIISSILFRLGGWGGGDSFCPLTPKLILPKSKWVAYLANYSRLFGIGAVIGLLTRSWWPVLTYLIATNVPYGDNDQNWLRKLVGRDANWYIYGGLFGLASWPVVGLWAIWQVMIGGLGFNFLMSLSNDGIEVPCGRREAKMWYLDHSYVELIFGLLGTAIYFKGV